MGTRPNEKILKVSGRTDPRKLAASIKQEFHAGSLVKIFGVGKEAVNNAVLGIGFASKYCEIDVECDFDVAFVPDFSPVDRLGKEGGDGKVTAIAFQLLKIARLAAAKKGEGERRGRKEKKKWAEERRRQKGETSKEKTGR